ncbi:MAG: hypothetical protein GTO51_07385 [Candidatus Latescibacteria bacterium]|nr:hypothetical protein [Candidatus Latescibacterota bacterium]NIO56773.1 hypothetical protein [Candidatus Latescibacterota bacterium]
MLLQLNVGHAVVEMEEPTAMAGGALRRYAAGARDHIPGNKGVVSEKSIARQHNHFQIV